MDTRRQLLASLTFACLATLGGSVAAHHSQTGFDPSATPIELKGTVAEYRWRNPHVLMGDEPGHDNAQRCNHLSPQSYASTVCKNACKTRCESKHS